MHDKQDMKDDFFRSNDILWLTNRCNNNCIICQDKVPGLDISKSMAEIKAEICNLTRDGRKRIVIYGGEPYLNSNMLSVLEYLSKEHISCMIHTNARVYAKECIADSLLKINAEVVSTLFSNRKEIHDRITETPGSFDQTISGFKNLVAREIPLTVTIVLTSMNTVDLPETAGLLCDLGASCIKISGLVDQGRMKNRHELIPPFGSVVENIKKAMEILNSRTKKPDILFEKLPFCAVGSYHDRFLFEKQHQGNILIWPHDKMQCKGCRHKKMCMALLK
ncbi:radical SAM protein [Candidatus Woesearchaeota archaeon]|nr:radical SAM protein [Candidatus Woesearchaeota archaeon]